MKTRSRRRPEQPLCLGKPTFGGTRGNAQGGPIAAVCSDRERQSTARPQLLREQAIINGLVRRDRHTRFSRKTHYGAIPGFKLGRLAVDNVSLQRRRRVFGEAIEKRHRVGNDTCRQPLAALRRLRSPPACNIGATAASQVSCG
jgi:hypothetical protein